MRPNRGRLAMRAVLAAVSRPTARKREEQDEVAQLLADLFPDPRAPRRPPLPRFQFPRGPHESLWACRQAGCGEWSSTVRHRCRTCGSARPAPGT